MPIALLSTLTVYGFIKRINSVYYILHLIMAIVLAISFFVETILYAFGPGMCERTTRKVLFQDRTDPSVKIVERDFGCGATDSEPATTDTYKIKELAFYFILSTKVDTNKIDKTQWTRIENPK